MAAKKGLSMNDSLTTAVKKEENKYKGPTVQVFLPELENSGEEGMQVDQYEHVTIQNEEGKEIFYVHRGEHVDVPVPVYMVLKEKYPKL